MTPSELPAVIRVAVTREHIAQGGVGWNFNPLTHALNELGYDPFFGYGPYAEVRLLADKETTADYELDNEAVEWLLRCVSRERVEPLTICLKQVSLPEWNFLVSLEDARACPDGVVQLEGDWGGQTYVICPARQVECSAATLEELLADVDALAWGNPHGTYLNFVRAVTGQNIGGGMGGGLVTDRLWVHPHLEAGNPGISEQIAAVLAGLRRKLREP